MMETRTLEGRVLGARFVGSEQDKYVIEVDVERGDTGGIGYNELRGQYVRLTLEVGRRRWDLCGHPGVRATGGLCAACAADL